MIILFLFGLIILLTSSIKPLIEPPRTHYQTFLLMPDVDWTNPEIQQAWESHGRLVGRFLSEETPLTIIELSVLCNAHIVQHGNPYKQTFGYTLLEWELHHLFKNHIVFTAVWKAFPTSSTEYYSPGR